MKYQVVEINEYLINIKEYDSMEEAAIDFKTSIEDAKEFPMLKIKRVYLTAENGIAAEWENK